MKSEGYSLALLLLRPAQCTAHALHNLLLHQGLHVVVTSESAWRIKCASRRLVKIDVFKEHRGYHALVDLLDLDLLIRAFDSTPSSANWNENADFNCDLSVDVLDLDILVRNFDMIGDE